MKGAIAALILALSAGLTVSCGESTQDSQINTRDTTGADVYNMPDGFSNFAEKCDKYGNLIVVIYHGSSTEGPGPYGAVAGVKGGCEGKTQTPQ